MAKRISPAKSVESITGTARYQTGGISYDAAYKTLIENLPQKVFIKDTNSIYISCNENFARGFGVNADVIVGKTDYDLFPREVADRRRAYDKRIMDSGKTEEFDVSNLQGGKTIHEHVVKTTLKYKNGKVIGIIGVISDIPDFKA
jgi:PAS domain S-box-containing protein